MPAKSIKLPVKRKRNHSPDNSGESRAAASDRVLPPQTSQNVAEMLHGFEQVLELVIKRLGEVRRELGAPRFFAIKKLSLNLTQDSTSHMFLESRTWRRRMPNNLRAVHSHCIIIIIWSYDIFASSRCPFYSIGRSSGSRDLCLTTESIH